jgi:serine/threonine protein kinase
VRTLRRANGIQIGGDVKIASEYLRPIEVQLGDGREKILMGEGAFSEVYKGIYMGKEVAVKIFKDTTVTAKENYGLGLQGFLNLEKAGYPEGLNPFISGGKLNGNQFAIVMKIIPGEETFTILQTQVESGDGPFTEDRAKQILSGALEYLIPLHAAEFVHRDIKLENFMTDTSEEPWKTVVIDWDSTSRIGVTDFKGTFGYMAPEIFWARINNNWTNAADVRPADMFSLGVALFVMLCGYYPFPIVEDINRLSPSDKHSILGRGRTVHATFPVSPRVSEDMKAIIISLLQREPTHRPSAKVVLATLKDSGSVMAEDAEATAGGSGGGTMGVSRVDSLASNVSREAPLTPREKEFLLRQGAGMEIDPQYAPPTPEALIKLEKLEKLKI